MAHFLNLDHLFIHAFRFNATSRFLDKTIGRSTAYIAARVSGRTPGQALDQAAEHGSAFDPADNPPKAATPTAEPEMDEPTRALRDKNKQTLRGMEWDGQSKGEQYQRLLAEESKLRERRRREKDPAAQEQLIERELEVTQKLSGLQRELGELKKRNEEAFRNLLLESMSDEEKVNHLLRERLDLFRQIGREQDPFKKEELVARMAQADNQLRTAQMESPKAFQAAQQGLLSQRARVQQQLGREKNPEAREELQQLLARTTADLQNLQAQAAQVNRPAPGPSQVDSLTRIGLFVGGGSNGLKSVENRLSQILEQQKRATRGIENLNAGIKGVF